MNPDRIARALLNGALRSPRRTQRRGQRRLTMPRGYGGGKVAMFRLLAGFAMQAFKTFLDYRAKSAPAPTSQRPAAPAGSGRRIPNIGAALPGAAPGPDLPPWGQPAAAPVSEARAEQREAVLMLRAMIAAAAADGLDDEEQALLAGQLDRAGLSATEREEVLAEFDRPATPGQLAAAVADPMQAAQLYAAAYAATGDISPAERAFLDELAAALGLARDAVAGIEARIEGKAG